MKIYELSSANGTLFSPPCWRTRLALELLGLDYQSMPVPFTKIKDVDEGQFATVPIMQNESVIMNDSFIIAEYLNTTYAIRTKLFPSAAEKAQAIFMQKIMDHIHQLTGKALLYDIFESVADEDKEYFRASREKKIGKTLEEIKPLKDATIEAMLTAYANLEGYAAENDFWGGDKPNYADITILSHLQLPAQIGGIKVLEALPNIKNWTEKCAKHLPSVGLWNK